MADLSTHRTQYLQVIRQQRLQIQAQSELSARRACEFAQLKVQVEQLGNLKRKMEAKDAGCRQVKQKLDDLAREAQSLAGSIVS